MLAARELLMLMDERLRKKQHLRKKESTAFPFPKLKISFCFHVFFLLWQKNINLMKVRLVQNFVLLKLLFLSMQKDSSSIFVCAMLNAELTIK